MSFSLVLLFGFPYNQLKKKWTRHLQKEQKGLTTTDFKLKQTPYCIN